MPAATSTTKIIASGAWIQVRVKDVSNNAMKIIGLCTDVSCTESFEIQPMTVLEHIGAVSLDSHGYKCSIRIGSFVPESPNAPDKYEDKGEVVLADIMPVRSDVMLDGRGKTFYYLDFYNAATKKVLGAFAHVVITDGGMRIGANSYITHDISLEAMERTREATTAENNAGTGGTPAYSTMA